MQARGRFLPSILLPSPQREARVADEPPGRGSPSVRAASFKRVPIPWELGWHGWGPRSKGQSKLGHLSPGDRKGRSQMCKEVTSAHAAPSSAEEPPPAFVQPSVERSISLPPAACLAAARSNFLCIVPITAPPFPAHPTPSVHHTARLPMPQRLHPTSLLRKCPC